MAQALMFEGDLSTELERVPLGICACAFDIDFAIRAGVHRSYFYGHTYIYTPGI